MKSMLQESSSVAKAVQQAWQEAGKPTEFTLKVLQEEEKNFFGMTRKPAIVSIIYDPRKVPSVAKAPTRRKEERSERPRRGEARTSRQLRKASVAEDRGPRQGRGRESSRIKEPARGSSSGDRRSGRASLNDQEQDRIMWSDNYLEMIGDWLREILTRMNITTKFGVSLDRGLLKIQFDGPVVESADGERILFASLVALLLQFLRRAEKKKLRGLRLAIVSRR